MLQLFNVQLTVHKINYNAGRNLQREIVSVAIKMIGCMHIINMKVYKISLQSNFKSYLSGL